MASTKFLTRMRILNKGMHANIAALLSFLDCALEVTRVTFSIECFVQLVPVEFKDSLCS